MQRSICYCESAFALAGQVKTWKFIVTPGIDLPKGSLIKFDLGSSGRQIDWETPHTDLKKHKNNVIYLELPNAKQVQAKEIEVPLSYVPQFEFKLPEKIEAGTELYIYIGALDRSKKEDGTRAQLTVQRRRPFYIYFDQTGKGNYASAEEIHLDVKGNTLETIRILGPSMVSKNRRFDIVLRFEDSFGNLTSNAPDETLIEVTHENLRNNLSWKLFVPETGFITLPNLYFNETGVFTIKLHNLYTDECFYSGPIKCFAEEVPSLFWGILHGESERFDSTQSIENCLKHFRDEKSYHFFATSPFESLEETSQETWKSVSQAVEEFNEDERFCVFNGFQWFGEPGQEGLRNAIFAKQDKPIPRKKEARTNSLKKLYKVFSPKELISIPSFSMGKEMHYDFKEFNQEFERLVEIYNAWGLSECTQQEGNSRPISGSSKKCIKETAEGSIIKALQNNKRFGFISGGLDDRGVYASFYESDQEQYSPGMTAVFAEQLSRASIFEAFYNRHCYATTGARIIIGLALVGEPMGSELNTAKKPGLLVNRHLTGYVAGTSKIERIEIIRNGEIFHTIKPKSHFHDFVYDDETPLDKCVINKNKEEPPFVFYYLRVIQEDGHMAWSSPIWVDLLKKAPKAKKTVDPLDEEE